MCPLYVRRVGSLTDQKTYQTLASVAQKKIVSNAWSVTCSEDVRVAMELDLTDYLFDYAKRNKLVKNNFVKREDCKALASDVIDSFEKFLANYVGDVWNEGR